MNYDYEFMMEDVLVPCVLYTSCGDFLCIEVDGVSEDVNEAMNDYFIANNLYEDFLIEQAMDNKHDRDVHDMYYGSRG